MMVFAQIVGPTFEPKPYAATQIGEIAGEIKSSAWRSLMGLPQPEVEPEPASVWDYLAIVAPVLGIGALVLSLISGIMRENWRFSAYGATLGSAAIIFQFLWWMTLVILGVLLLVAIIENIGDIFSW
ncbi:MAG: hypothetical protein KI792_11045 [Alphaproteobacteria bacterium]|nr:hypothetical protein [Alphaproteobacteria bacterium SS10]